ncbi:hypothetical protein G6F43_005396 [Rhizopus delemar]|nr:hypothetical protein G6F43_005396 [Rhizopus delemar]
MSDTRDDQLNTSSSTSTFVSALWFNAALAIGFFGVFNILRTRRPQTYSPRSYAVDKERRPPPLPDGYLKWIFALLKIPDDQIIKSIGLDRFMVLKLLRMGIITFAIYSLVAIPILFPVITINQGNLSGLNYLTMGNITDSNRTWANCLLAILLSGLVWYYTFRETRIYIALRRKYLLSPEYANTVAARTIYVPSIPNNVNNAKELERIFSNFPGGVRRIWLNRQLDDLPDLVTERIKAVASLESAVTKAILATYKYHLKKGDLNKAEAGNQAGVIPEKLRPSHRESSLPIPLPCIGEKVDTIHFYHDKINQLNQTIQEKQKQVPSFNQYNSAFIEFHSQMAAHMAGQSLIHQDSMHMAPRHIAIAPSDVIWENMNIRSFERLVRRFISMLITTAIIIFWAVPVVFVQAVANLEKLSKIVPFLSGLDDVLGPTAVGIIQGILPAVALSILISLVPVIFTFLSKSEGIPQNSFVELSVLHKFFFFQLVDVVLVSTISGGFFSMINQLQSLIQNPLGIIDVLSENLPQASTFFITFVMLQSTNQSGQAMAQIVPYILSYIKPIFSTTPRDIYNQKNTCPNVNLGTLVPTKTVIFILGLEYGVIAPLILPFVLLFFCLHYFVYLYQFLYVYEMNYETGGRAFPRAIRHIYIGLFVSQLTLIGLFAIRKDAMGQMALMIVTLILTAFALFYYDKAFKPLFKYLPVATFEDKDIKVDIKAGSVSDDSVSDHEQGNSSALTKVHTHNNNATSTAVEAFEARRELLERLREQELSDKKLEAEDAEVAGTAKSLYSTEAYMHPSIYNPKPTVWLPEDDLGITKKEIDDLKKHDILSSSRSATIVRNRKGKGNVTIDVERLITEREGIPGTANVGPNLSNLNTYIRVLVDNFNLAGAATMY